MGEKSKKEKKSKKKAPEVAAVDAVEKKVVLAPIAKPIADDKLTKKARFHAFTYTSIDDAPNWTVCDAHAY